MKEAITLFHARQAMPTPTKSCGAGRDGSFRSGVQPRSLVPAYWVAAAAMFLTALFPCSCCAGTMLLPPPARWRPVMRPLRAVRRGTVGETSTARSPPRFQLPCRRWPIPGDDETRGQQRNIRPTSNQRKD